MHEAGVAARVAAAVRMAGVSTEGRPLRLRVRGGCGDPAAFDAALRLHLSAQLPDLAGPIEITHAAEPTLCSVCLRPYQRVGEESCPTCGGAGLPVVVPESVEIVEEEDPPCA